MGYRIASLHLLRSPRGGGEDSDAEDAYPERSRSARRSIAVLKYIAQDRPDLSLATRALAEYMSKPLIGPRLGLRGPFGVYKDLATAMWLSDPGKSGLIHAWTAIGEEVPFAEDRVVAVRLSLRELCCVTRARVNPASPFRQVRRSSMQQ